MYFEIVKFLYNCIKYNIFVDYTQNEKCFLKPMPIAKMNINTIKMFPFFRKYIRNTFQS